MTVFAGLKLPKVIYETNTPYNGKVQVVEVGKSRKVIVDNILQSLNCDSPVCNRLYWGKTIEILKQEVPDMKSFMLLGLGGGTLNHLISRSFPQAGMVSVEIDKTMLDIANNYFDLASVKNNRVIIADALKVVVEPEQFELKEHSFDVLFVDIYSRNCQKKIAEFITDEP